MLLLLAALLGSRAHAQSLDADFEVWNAAATTASLGSKPHALQLWFDVHARRGGVGTTLIVRPGLGVRLSKGFILWVGYAFVPFFQVRPGSPTGCVSSSGSAGPPRTLPWAWWCGTSCSSG